jgi:hypothetical protein
MCACSWCGNEIETAAPAPRPAPHAVSHGICRPCLELQLLALERSAPARPWAALAETQAAA